MNQLFQQFILKHQLATKNDQILVAVSGGIDSIALTDLLSKTSFNISVAHCNFGLRNEANDESSFVQEFCEERNIRFHKTNFSTTDFANQNKLSIQMAARKLRYDYFESLCNDFGYNLIATGHHLDDSIETFFINLFRKSGADHLAGIPVKHKNVIRPLLFATRTQIEQHAKSNELNWKEDSSNEKDDYLRNRIRHHFIPILKEEFEDFYSFMQNLLNDFTVINEYRKKEAMDFIHKNVRCEKKEVIVDLIKELNADLTERVLDILGGRFNGSDILSSQTGSVFYSGRNVLLKDRESLILKRKDYTLTDEIQLEGLPCIVNLNGVRFHLEKSDLPDNLKMTGIQYVDLSSITFPLTIRRWQPGDSFHPLGMKGRKKVSDFLIDRKVNLFDKDHVMVMLSGNNIVCILGHQIDHLYRVTETTKEVLKISTS